MADLSLLYGREAMGKVVELCVLILVALVGVEGGDGGGSNGRGYSRADFPADFIFGSGTSAYQVEGAAKEDGRTPSIFDTFTLDESWHGGNGDVAVDGYHKYKEDVQLMVETGLDAYRFSISWSRLIPNGRGPVNPKGLEFYNNFINELIKHGMEPHVTLFHVDLPQVLEDEYTGFLSRKIIADFTAFADVCFREFGDRVLHWTTFNEGNIFVMGGYDTAETPPRRCSAPFGLNCHGGNSTTEPYIATHNMLLAHAAAARLYKTKYQAKQHGFIGINLFAFNTDPATNSTEDLIASQRFCHFFTGWFMHPLTFGDYPEIMRRNAGKRLPNFTEDESELVKGSFDFIGINHYSTLYIKDNPKSLELEVRDFLTDSAVEIQYFADGASQGGFPIMAWGLQGALEYFKQFYGNPPVYIHENGQKTYHNTSVNDPIRVEYLQGYIGSLLDAIRNGSNARGYFTWSFLDVFELLDGYVSSFGLYYVDFNDPDLKRYPKLSQRWYSSFLKGERINLSDVHAGNDPGLISQIENAFSVMPQRRSQRVTSPSGRDAGDFP
ncbi:Beta-glucosidase 11-like protein [Drosera capensis]